MTTRYTTYLRVSTSKQGESGLGLEAQRASVERFVAATDGAIVAEYLEIESGKRSDRKQLTAALAHCRATRSTLLIARLDRLSRNVAFIANLMEAGVEFKAVDMPNADRTFLHVMAALAEDYTRKVSANTKAALAAAKARGVKLGNPQLKPGNAECAKVATDALMEKARDRAASVAPYITAARKAGATTLQQLADAMTARGVATPSGRGVWTPCTVSRVLAYAA